MADVDQASEQHKCRSCDPLRISSAALYNIARRVKHVRWAKGNPVPIPEPGSGAVIKSGPH